MIIKTIDVQAKEWFDKANGNSYFSAQVTINFGEPDCIGFSIPFQYGYGEHYKQSTLEALKKRFNITTDTASLDRYARENNITLRASIETGCKQSDVKAWGKE